MCCCCRELQSSCGVSLREGQTSRSFERACDPTAMPQTGKDFQCFAAGSVCGQKISLRTVDIGQICQGARRTPGISGLAECGERSVIQLSSYFHIALRARYIALL